MKGQLQLNNVTLERFPLTAKDKTGDFFFRYISVSKDTLIVVSDSGEERSYRLDNRFERTAVKRFIGYTKPSVTVASDIKGGKDND